MTPSIKINVDDEAGNFQLSGEITFLKSNRRARFFMNDYLNADLSSNEMITIPYIKDVEDDKEKVMAQIQDMFVKFGISEVLTESSKKILSEFLEEKERFEEFSIKAKKIWDNDLDRNEFANFIEVLKKELPNRTLYDLQLLAAYHLTFSQNACNFSVPGAGKTSVVYAAYAYLRSLPKDHKKYINRLFVIGPLSSFGPWKDEYKECFGEEANVQVLSGGVSREERVRHLLSPYSTEITLISYQGVASHLEDIISYLHRHENKVMVVLDEAHKIKNTEGGLWAQSVLSIAKYCKARIVLTGTPMPNGYEDIYNLYNFIWPGKDIINFHLYQLKEMSQAIFDKRIPQLIENLSPFFIRITKKDLKKHMGLPEAIENEPFIVEMNESQRYIYDYIEKNYLDYFQVNDTYQGPQSNLVYARLIRLMQAATNPALLRKPIEEYYHEKEISSELFIDDSGIISKILNYGAKEVPSKFEHVARLTKKIIDEGGKVIIWGIFIQNIRDLKEYLFKLGLDARLLIGETPVETDSGYEEETRESIIREFNSSNSSFNIIIANPFAVAESISLHKACHNAIYLERNFNAASFIQSKDRIHRVGLKPDDKINYYYFLSKNSIDGTIHSRLKEKEQRMLEIIESREIPLIDMNMDYKEDLSNDIKALIRDYVGRAAENK
ncbi:MAG: DEAD/DEAH box helicase [Bacteroidia bacterium]